MKQQRITRKKAKPKLQIVFNEFGEMILSKDYTTINDLLDRQLFDKKNRIPTMK